MRIQVVSAGILCAFAVAVQARDLTPGVGGAEPDPVQIARVAPSESLSIRVLPGDWGGAARDDIDKLLVAVARELWVYFPQRRLGPILVAPSEQHPLAQFAKGPGGETVVYLSAKGRHWSQYAYQFAHEFAHILSNYERNGASAVRRNQWFDESLCETAALFTLRRLGATWLEREVVPYPHWRPYGSALQSYAKDLLGQPHRALVPQSAFVAWYRGNAAALDKSPYLRDLEEVVAGMLLPLFEAHPEAWATIGYVNLEESDATGPFEQYLANWYRNTPPRDRPLVANIIQLFGFEPPAQLASRNAAQAVPQSR